MKRRPGGFSAIEVIIVFVIITSIGAGVWFAVTSRQTKDKGSSTTQSSKQVTQSDNNVTWSYTGEKWQPSSTPPACPDPLTIKTPVNIGLVDAILYPGQVRGGDFKPHGGFHVKSSNAIDVVAPMDATLVQGSRYIEMGETQILLEFVNSCGIMYRFDHILTPSPAMQKAVDSLPTAKPNDSRTTKFSETIKVKAGDSIVTTIGFIKAKNTGFDFGVYDLRSRNEASKDSAFSSAHQDKATQAFYAVCWLELLPEPDKSRAAALPGGDGKMGKTSDYCK